VCALAPVSSVVKLCTDHVHNHQLFHTGSLSWSGLSPPVSSLDAQSVDSRPSCEACLCWAESVYDVSWLSWSLHHYCRSLSLSWRRSRQPRQKAHVISLCTSSKAIHPSSRVIWLSQHMTTKAMVEYHPDKQLRYDQKWQVLSGEISKAVNDVWADYCSWMRSTEFENMRPDNMGLENWRNKRQKDKTMLSGDST